jgi:hypothetical protein
MSARFQGCCIIGHIIRHALRVLDEDDVRLLPFFILSSKCIKTKR